MSVLLQVYGFVLIAATCVVLAAAWSPLRASPRGTWLLFSLYIAFNFSVNWGPGTACFVLPQEVLCFNFFFLCCLTCVQRRRRSITHIRFCALSSLFEKIFAVEIRTTFNGIAAASGKLGAFIGIWIFEKVGCSTRNQIIVYSLSPC